MYDVIVVGGGVGGLSLASRLEGLNVLVFEKSKEITLRDSGIVSSQFDEFFKSKGMIKEKINKMELLSRKELVTIKTRKPFAYILKREKFTSHLRKLAGRKAEIKYETVTGVSYSQGSAAVRTKSGENKCRVVVGADGCNSIVRRAAGIRQPRSSIGIMIITESMKGRNIKVFFNKHYSPDFFSWIIPRNREYGIISTIRPREYMDFFRAKENLGEGRIYSYPIPVGSTKSFSDNTILIGDSCGQVKPLTGGGIMFSLRAAKHAGRTITSAFSDNRFDRRHLESYERAWKRDFGAEIIKQLIFRKMYRRLSNQDVDTFFAEFKEAVENLGWFDYDKFSSAWIKMPKMKLLKAAVLTGNLASRNLLQGVF